jgi:hypothetical protein
MTTSNKRNDPEIEWIKNKLYLVLIAITAAGLVFLLGLPLWAAMPAITMATVAVWYAILKRRESKKEGDKS